MSYLVAVGVTTLAKDLEGYTTINKSYQVVDKSKHHQAKTTLYLTDLSVEYLTHHEDIQPKSI